MRVKLYKRLRGHDATQLLESITENTDLVKVQSSDYDAEPYVVDLDFEDRIICGKEIILSNPKKVVSIIDMEMFMKNHMWQEFEYGDIVEFESYRFIKAPKAYVAVEIKN